MAKDCFATQICCKNWWRPHSVSSLTWYDFKFIVKKNYLFFIQPTALRAKRKALPEYNFRRKKGKEDLQVHPKIHLEFKNCMCINNKLRPVQFSSPPPLLMIPNVFNNIHVTYISQEHLISMFICFVVI